MNDLVQILASVLSPAVAAKKLKCDDPGVLIQYVLVDFWKRDGPA